MSLVLNCFNFCFGEPEKDKYGILEQQDFDDTGHGSRETDHIQNKEAYLKLHSSYKSKLMKKRSNVFARQVDIDDNWKFPHYKKSKDVVRNIDLALLDNFIFDHLDKEERTLLINAMQKKIVKKDTVIIEQGDVDSDYFYIVESGTVDYIVDGKDVGSCTAGGSFGELALLYDAPRAATCKAMSDCILWQVDQTTFKKMLAKKAKEEENEIYSVLSKIPILEGCDDETKKEIADAVTLVTFKENSPVIKKGDIGDIFYIIKDGSVKVHDIGFGSSKFEDQILTSSDWFGEYALITNEPRSANVTAITDCNVYALSRSSFNELFGTFEDVIEKSQRIKYLKSVPVFGKQSDFTQIEYRAIVDLFVREEYKAGAVILKEGEIVDPLRMFVVHDGRLIINHQGTLYRLTDGDYFSDTTMLYETPQPSPRTVTCDTDTILFSLSKKDLVSVIGDIARLGKFSDTPTKSLFKRQSIQLEDVTKHKILGVGAFGKVWLATVNKKVSVNPYCQKDNKSNGGIYGKSCGNEKGSENQKETTAYALKVLNKRQLILAKQVQSTLREKNILSTLYNDFLLGMVASFQDDNYAYLLTELIPGGELFNVIHTAKRDGLPQYNAKFYGACVLEGISYLHKRSIVYRDLKPENVLVNDKGYCVICDMGFAKIVVDKTYTLCGTPEYLPPEIIMSKGHDLGCDYWSFGVLLYEMVVGSSPFFDYGMNQQTLFKNIVMVNYDFPRHIEKNKDKFADFMDIVQKLLVRKNSQRLGKLAGGTDDIKNHPWFKSDIDFDKLCNGEIKAPWIPKVQNPFDSLNHFDSNSFQSEEKESIFDDEISKEKQELFEGF